MRKVRDVRVFVYLSVGVAAVLAVGVGAWRAYAGEDLSDDIRVSLASIATASPITIYTPGGEVQELMPIYASTLVGREVILSGYPIDPESVIVDVTTGGTLEVNGGIPEVIDPIEAVSGDVFLASPLSGTQHLSVFNAGLLDYQDENLGGGLTGLVALNVLRAVATADSYYLKGVTTTEVAEETMDITLLDAASVDGDGNGIPDATALLEPFTLMMGPDNKLTYVVDLGELGRGSSSNGAITFGLRTEGGAVRIDVDAPTMNQLANAEAIYNLYAGRLIVNVATDPVDLVDLPDSADPLSEFDLAGEEPRGLFIHAALAVTDAVDARGATPEWTFLGELPGDLVIRIEITGPGLSSEWTNGDLGFGYIYGTQPVQLGEDILIETAAGWGEASTFEVVNAYNGNDARGGTDVAAGDDTLFFETQSGSAIIASNLMPLLTAEDDDDDDHHKLCFIATAAYGTPMAAEINSLRDVRDAYMLGNPLGTAFVDAYYRVSPPIARMVSEYPVLKAGTRAMLTPVVAVSGWTMAAPGTVALATLLLIAAIAAMRRFVLLSASKP